MSAKKVNQMIFEVLVYTFALIILILTSININSFFKPKEVLGIKTVNNNKEFWREFLSKNPDYIPGWIEVGELEKARTIDPSYNF
jgi:hypothetical protein